MKTLKKYQAPAIRTEEVRLGVYGCYGDTGTNPGTPPPAHTPIRIFNPFFHFCCS